MSKFLRELHSTNFRIFVGVLLAAFLVLYTVAAGVAVGLWEKEVLLSEDYLEILRNFVLVILAIDAGQFVAKRMTHKRGGADDPDDRVESREEDSRG